jgi:N-acetylglucosaminyldiphosphoundecaprenol N-acetyl-beta-D-mannosaminyltransferase
MGVPRQERFLEEHWASLGVSLAIPVGGSFEVIAGTKKRAPAQLQRVGFEWLYRLVQQPRRLWKRYLVTNTQFLYLSLGELLFGGGGVVEDTEATTPAPSEISELGGSTR